MPSNYAKSSQDGRTRQSRANHDYDKVIYLMDVALSKPKIRQIQPYALGAWVTTKDGTQGRITHYQGSIYDNEIHYYFVNGICYEHQELSVKDTNMGKLQERRRIKIERQKRLQTPIRLIRQRMISQFINWLISFRYQVDHYIAVTGGYILWRLLIESKVISIGEPERLEQAA